LVVEVVAGIAAEVAIANSASAPVGTSPSIQTRPNARIAAGLADAPPVATPELSRLESLMIDRSCHALSIQDCLL
jgi:hypothetical protein